jgi:hypothetical protein
MLRKGISIGLDRVGYTPQPGADGISRADHA